MAFHTGFRLATVGYIGVDVFFVLSGFLITMLLLQDYGKGEMGLRRFYLLRAARLLPALAVVCAVVGVGYVILRPSAPETRETLYGVLAALTYTAAWFTAFSTHRLGWIGPTWSLSVEEHFYLLWPVVLRWLWSPDATRLFRRVSFIVALALASRVAGAVLGASARHLYFGPDFRAEQLLLGCVLATAFFAGLGLKRTRWDGVVVAAGIVWLLGALVSPAFGSGLMVPAPSSQFYNSGGSTAIAFASAVVIRHLLIREDGGVARVLSIKSLVWVGRRSYGLYLWHYPIYGLFTPVASRLRVPAEVGLSFVVAALSYRWVEMPVRTWMRSRESQSQATEARLRKGP